jgi:hypothetical protein
MNVLGASRGREAELMQSTGQRLSRKGGKLRGTYSAMLRCFDASMLGFAHPRTALFG